MQSRPPTDTPLGRGSLYGLLLCLTGIGAGVGAYAIGGWVSVPIWLAAVLLIGSGLWTAGFTGGWLSGIWYVSRRPDERRR